MTRLFSSRDAAAFDAAVARGADAPLTESDVRRFAELLAIVDDLRAVPELTPRPEFSAALRERLLTEADTALVAQPQRASTQDRLTLPTRSRGDRRIATLLGGAALVGATASIAVGAQAALPGQALYPIKQGLEKARIEATRDSSAHSVAMLDRAATRLDEVDTLVGESSSDRLDLVGAALDAYSEQSQDAAADVLAAYEQGGSDEQVQQLLTFSENGLRRLDALEATVPTNAHDNLVAAGETLTDIRDRAQTACPSCSTGSFATPDFMVSTAPVGASVDSLIAAANDNPQFAKPVKPTKPKTTKPDSISGQEVENIEVPDFQVPDSGEPTSAPTNAAPPPTTGPKGPTGQVKTPDTTKITKPLQDVAESLTGVTGTVGELTGTGTVVDGLNDAITGTVDGVTGAVDNITKGLTGAQP